MQANVHSAVFPRPRCRPFLPVPMDPPGMGRFFPVDASADASSQSRASAMDSFPDSLIDSPRTPVVLAGNVGVTQGVYRSCWKGQPRGKTSNSW